MNNLDLQTIILEKLEKWSLPEKGLQTTVLTDPRCNKVTVQKFQATLKHLVAEGYITKRWGKRMFWYSKT